MKTSRKKLVVWQWNCRGFNRKRAELQFLIEQTEVPPDVIALQEPGKRVKCNGYQTLKAQDNHNTAILVQRNISAKHEQFDG